MDNSTDIVGGASSRIAKKLLLTAVVVCCTVSYGLECAVKKEKHLGQVYTPTYLVQDILDVAEYRIDGQILEKHVIDNSCGNGAFLDEVVRRYIACFMKCSKNKRTLERHLSKFVHGIELDVGAYTSCVKRLNAIAVEFGLENVVWDIRNADTLSVHDYDGRMDFVVGNPPYVRVHNLAENFAKVKTFGFSNGGMTDLYLVFYEVGLRMLSQKGRLCYIAPSSWINSLAGKNMRDYIRENGCLCGIVDLGHYQPFDATAYTAIALLCLGGRKEFDYWVYDGEHQMRHVARLAYDEAFFSSALYLGDKKSLKMHRRIVQSVVPQYVKVKNGFATLADGVFISDDFAFTDFVIPVLKASTGKWRKCFFPYDKNGRPIPKETLFRKADVKMFLQEHKDELLKGRDDPDREDWYLFGRTQALRDVAVEKFAINTCIKDVASIKLNRVPAGAGLYSGLYILTDVEERVLREVLLSEAFVDYVAELKKYKSGGYYTFSSRDLEQYLNFALHSCLSGEKKRMCQATMDL